MKLRAAGREMRRRIAWAAVLDAIVVVVRFIRVLGVALWNGVSQLVEEEFSVLRGASEVSFVCFRKLRLACKSEEL